MFIVFLKFTSDRSRAPQFVEGHKEWIRRGFDDGVFLLTGSLLPEGGGAVVAHGTSLADLKVRVDADPFVAQGVVAAEILELAPSRVDERLAFLNERAP